jgi:hypothetical protein
MFTLTQLGLTPLVLSRFPISYAFDHVIDYLPSLVDLASKGDWRKSRGVVSIKGRKPNRVTEERERERDSVKCVRGRR